MSPSERAALENVSVWSVEDVKGYFNLEKSAAYTLMHKVGTAKVGGMRVMRDKLFSYIKSVSGQSEIEIQEQAESSNYNRKSA